MEIDFLDFIEQCRHIAKQPLGKHADEPVSGGSPAGSTLYCFRLEDGHSYRETPTRLTYMTESCDALGLNPDNLPDFTTLYKSFDRLEMWV